MRQPLSLASEVGRSWYGMTEPSGRRERKKAAARQKIADTALRLFLEREYDAVGIREVAAEADVAVATLFSYFVFKRRPWSCPRAPCTGRRRGWRRWSRCRWPGTARG
jgi:hypothetical protein